MDSTNNNNNSDGNNGIGAEALRQLRQHYRLPPESEYLVRVAGEEGLKRLPQQHHVSWKSHKGGKHLYACGSDSDYYCYFKLYAVRALIPPTGAPPSPYTACGNAGDGDAASTKCKGGYHVFMVGEHHHSEHSRRRDDTSGKGDRKESTSSQQPAAMQMKGRRMKRGKQSQQNHLNTSFGSSGGTGGSAGIWRYLTTLGSDEELQQYLHQHSLARAGRRSSDPGRQCYVCRATYYKHRGWHCPHRVLVRKLESEWRLYWRRTHHPACEYGNWNEAAENKNAAPTAIIVPPDVAADHNSHTHVITLGSQQGAMLWLKRYREPLRKCRQSALKPGKQRYRCSAEKRYYCFYRLYTQLRDDGRVEVWERGKHDHSRMRQRPQPHGKLDGNRGREERPASSSSKVGSSHNIYHYHSIVVDTTATTSAITDSLIPSSSSAAMKHQPALPGYKRVARLESEAACARWLQLNRQPIYQVKTPAYRLGRQNYRCILVNSYCRFTLYTQLLDDGCVEVWERGLHDHSACRPLPPSKEKKRGGMLQQQKPTTSRAASRMEGSEVDAGGEDEMDYEMDWNQLGNAKRAHGTTSDEDTFFKSKKKGVESGTEKRKIRMVMSEDEDENEMRTQPMKTLEAIVPSISPAPPPRHDISGGNGETKEKGEGLADLAADSEKEQLDSSFFKVMDHEAEMKQLALELGLLWYARRGTIPCNSYLLPEKANSAAGAARGGDETNENERYVVVMDFPRHVVIIRHGEDDTSHMEEVFKRSTSWVECLQRVRQRLVEHLCAASHSG